MKIDRIKEVHKQINHQNRKIYSLTTDRANWVL